MSQHPEILRFGAYSLDFERRELRRDGRALELQPTPLRLLLYLAERRDRTVPKLELLDAIWPDATVGDASLATALAHVREALEDDGLEQRVVRTQRGLGYRFVAEVSEEANATTTAEPAADSAAPPAAETATATHARRRALAPALGGAALVIAVLAVSGAFRRPAIEPTPKLQRPVTVVLPFRNLSGDPALDPFVDGLTEQVSARIALRLDAIASASALAYKDKAYDVRDAGRALGATHALTGGVSREGDELRITYQIVAVASGRQLFSNVADYPAAGALAVQGLVATNATAATWAFVPWEWSNDPARNEVIELTQAGGMRHNMGEPATAIQMVERALRLDPTYAWAHMQLAFNWDNALNSGQRSAREALAKIAYHAAEAERLAPGSYEALEASSVPDKFHFRWAENERKARASCALARHPYFCVNLQLALLDTGQTREVIEIARGQIDMLPEASIAHSILAGALFVERRYAEAEREAAIALKTWPPGAYSMVQIPWMHWMDGRREEYVEAVRQARLRAGDTEGAAEIARIFAAEGPEAVARWDAEHPVSITSLPPFFQQLSAAVAHTLAGGTDAALDRLEDLPPFAEAPLILYWPVFDSLRAEPRFLAVVEKMGVTPYHAPYLARVQSGENAASAE